MKLSYTLPLFLLFLVVTPPVLAQDEAEAIDWKNGAWGDLSTYIGTYDYEAVLNDARVAAALEAQLGAKKLETLKDNLATHEPVNFENDCLLLSGSGGRDAQMQAAFTAVCLYKGVVHSAIKEEGVITLYTGATQYNYLPPALRVWIHTQQHPDMLNALPADVQFVPAP